MAESDSNFKGCDRRWVLPVPGQIEGGHGQGHPLPVGWVRRDRRRSMGAVRVPLSISDVSERTVQVTFLAGLGRLFGVGDSCLLHHLTPARDLRFDEFPQSIDRRVFKSQYA
jgi:hypothetical protein